MPMSVRMMGQGRLRLRAIACSDSSVIDRRSMHENWVFGYGSLMWNPGFRFSERRRAVIHGYHRSLCMLSHMYRGTPDRPGLVLGLDIGGACHGIAFKVADEDWPEAARLSACARAGDQHVS